MNKQLRLHAEMNIPNGPPPGNASLVKYGVFQDCSDVSIRVAFGCKRVFIFSTSKLRNWVKRQGSNLREVSVYQGSIETARGFCVPVAKLISYDELDRQSILIPDDLFKCWPVYKNDTEEKKGQMAVCYSEELNRRGLIPLSLFSKEITEKQEQIKGKDLLLWGRFTVQIKCDWPVGETGNFFIQTWECNPYRKH